MKHKTIFLLLAMSMIFSACLIKSFNPFYLTENVRFNEQLIGTWLDQDSTIWQFEALKDEKGLLAKKVEHPHYLLNYTEDEGKDSRFLVTLFSLDDVLYLDLFPDYETLSGHDLFSMHTLPVHTLAKLEISDASSMQIKWFNEEWVAGLINGKKTDIGHEMIYSPDDDEEASIVLTAKTAELQDFIRKFGDDPEAFDCDDQFSGDTFCRELTKKS